MFASRACAVGLCLAALMLMSQGCSEDGPETEDAAGRTSIDCRDGGCPTPPPTVLCIDPLDVSATLNCHGESIDGRYCRTGEGQPSWKQEPIAWPQMGADNSRCLGKTPFEVSNQMACQEEAVKKGHRYYQYAIWDKQLCFTAAACDSPLTGTSKEWKIYRRPDEAPSGTMNLRWAPDAKIWVFDSDDKDDKTVAYISSYDDSMPPSELNSQLWQYGDTCGNKGETVSSMSVLQHGVCIERLNIRSDMLPCVDDDMLIWGDYCMMGQKNGKPFWKTKDESREGYQPTLYLRWATTGNKWLIDKDFDDAHSVVYVSSDATSMAPDEKASWKTTCRGAEQGAPVQLHRSVIEKEAECRDPMQVTKADLSCHDDITGQYCLMGTPYNDKYVWKQTLKQTETFRAMYLMWEQSKKRWVFDNDLEDTGAVAYVPSDADRPPSGWHSKGWKSGVACGNPDKDVSITVSSTWDDHVMVEDDEGNTVG